MDGKSDSTRDSISKSGAETLGGSNIVVGRDAITQGGDFVAHDKVTVVHIHDLPVEIEDGYREKPSLDDIIRDLREHPPFQREAIAKHYIGLKVSWHLEFLNVRQRAGSKYVITFSLPGFTAVVRTEVNIDEYPELRILKCAHHVNVKGRISKIDPGLMVFTVVDSVLVIE